MLKPIPLVVIAVAAALALGGCKRKADDSDLARIDNQLVRTAGDAAANSALQDPILTDPTLSQRSNRTAVRPAEQPAQAQYPEAAGGAGPGCGAHFTYGPEWAGRLPPPFAVYPRARVTEAAADNQSGCALRVVSFLSDAAPDRLLDWYRARAEGAGFSAERQTRGADQILAGTGPGDGAFFLVVTPRQTGADVALITNKGV